MISYFKKLFESKPYVPKYSLSDSATILSGRFCPDIEYSDEEESPYDTIKYDNRESGNVNRNIKTFTLPDGSVVAIDADKTDMEVKSKLDI